jgi:hypothetical protein
MLYTCTKFGYALVEWDKSNGAILKFKLLSLESQMRVNRDFFFNWKNNRGKYILKCVMQYIQMGLSLGDIGIYRHLMNIWNDLPEFYWERAYQNTLAMVKEQIKKADKIAQPVPYNAPRVMIDVSQLESFVISEAALKEPQLGIGAILLPCPWTGITIAMGFT